MTYDPRTLMMGTIRAAMESGVQNQNSHPWIRPMWQEIKRLEQELAEAKAELAKKPAPKKTSKNPDESANG